MSGQRADTVGIIGAGRFGTALAQRLAGAGREVILWSTNADVVGAINDRRGNPRLPDVELAPGLSATGDVAELTGRARLLVLAVASMDARARLRILGDVVDGTHIIVHAIGALASPGQARVSELIATETPVLRIGALAGPALWADLVGGQFTSMVVASRFDEVGTEVRRLLGVPPALRIYRSHDLVGAELAAALSGAFTIAIGLSDALGVGPGPRAVLITRALAEASRIGEALGAEARTFSGLAGLGNLLVRSSPPSCQVSRDYQLGQALGRGEEPSEAAFTEGARAALAGVRLAESVGVRAPVLSALSGVLSGELSAREAAAAAGDSVAEEE